MQSPAGQPNASADDGSAAAVLDAAEDIINSIGAQALDEVNRERNKKRRWWRKKK